MTPEKTYKSIDLLNLIIEFKAMTPDTRYWNLDNIMGHPPTRVRFQQIQALIKAFLTKPLPPPVIPKKEEARGLNAFIINMLKGDSEKESHSEKPPAIKEYSINDIENAMFLDDRTAKDFEEVSALVINYLRERNHYFKEPVGENDYRWFHSSFVSLFRYKAKLNALLRSSIQECPPHFSAIIAVHLTDDIEDKLKGVSKELDQILELLVNPNKLQFTESELIARFGFPKENLYDVDGDHY